MSESHALFQAIQANDAATVTDLIEARAELLSAESPSGLSPLLFAAYYHRPQMAQLLIDLGAPVSPFEAAATGNQPRLYAALADNPALLQAYSSDGFSLLGLCAFFGHDEAAGQLLLLGADVNAVSRNPMRVSPLHSAAAGNHTTLAARLLSAGADPNLAQHGGYTPLHSAAQNGNLELVELLLAQGADPQARTDDGNTALDLARESEHAEVVARLAGPDTNLSEHQSSVKAGGVARGGGVMSAVHNGPMSDPNDKLITRDPQAMEHSLEDAEYAGSDTLEGLDSGLIEVRAGNLGGATVIPSDPAAEANQNPGYTPPGKMVSPHPHEGAADLPEGSPAEDELEQGGLHR